MSFDQGQSIQELVSSTADALEEAGLYFGHGTDNAWDEACWLVESLMRRHAIVVGEYSAALPKAFLDDVQALSRQRIKQRIPLAYLLNEAWFAGLPFYVDDRVLVPRSPIAELIQSNFSPLLRQNPQRILDLCTGSGCIGIATALQFPDSTVELSDLAEDALEVAGMNIQKHGLAERVKPIQSDLFASLSGKYDLILCNPPYVGDTEYENLPDEYHCEPSIGLLSKANGLAIPLAVLKQAGDFLNPGAYLILEVGNSCEALEAALPESPLLWLDFEFGGHGVCAIRADQLAGLKIS